MTNRAIAARYGKALFEVSLKDGDARAVERDLTAFVGLMAAHQDLQRVLTNPAIPVSKKQAIVKVLLDRDRVTPALARTIALLASRDRLVLLPELSSNYQERLLDREGVVRAEIATAAPVSSERLQEIERGLAAATGKRVAMAARVDPALIGGVVARIGSVVYDGSLTTQLRRLKETITGSGL